MRIKGPVLTLLILVLVTGTLVTLAFHVGTDAGDVAAQNRVKLSFVITLLLTIFILLVATGRWWHPHLWRHGNSQKLHRRRLRNRQSRHRRR